MPTPVRSIHISQDPERARGTRIHTHSVVTSAAATGSERKPSPARLPARPARLPPRAGRCLGPTAPQPHMYGAPRRSWLGRDPNTGLEGRGGAGRDDRRAGQSGRGGADLACRRAGQQLDLLRGQQHLPTPKPHFVAELKPPSSMGWKLIARRTLRSQRR